MSDRPRDVAEHWAEDAGDDDAAQLDIPPHATRERRFEIFCSFEVANPLGGDDAAHALRVLVDGAQAWTRRVATHAGSDSLDVRLRRVVPVGEPLRVTARTEVHGVRRVRLKITADEELDG
ncbi:hypothetical protein [Rhizobacter sp. SG703]|uniref:hypothetical protein n=1 Tax=Rhizobacter sp. SG703 TaxID=2587140 RepID=UPI001447EFB6|nr:hypothetical protein [Rhizobacter sp. SG703]NKI94600.1 hypothetical protein [Rhizobacter sp. SG703]